MKKLTPFLKFHLIGLSIFCITSGFSQTADPLATQTTKCILQYISGLSSQPGNKVISGQWMHHRPSPQSPQTEFDTSITSIYNQTTKWVGIIGTDYMREFSTPNYHTDIKNLTPVNQPLINYFRQGGLIFLMTSFKNPWNNSNMNDTTNAGNLSDIVTAGHPANIQFNKYLDSVAVGIAQLQDSGVTVVFRPFHELNGYWFWWGSRSPTSPTAIDLTTLWQYVFNYMTISKQLHNILWLYSPSIRGSNISNPSFKAELYYYPGNNYVDIIGLDEYKDTLDITPTSYANLLATGKPLGLGEFGPNKSTVTNAPFVYDYTRLIDQIKTKYPALCFWASWNHFYNGTNWIYYSLSTQNNTASLLSDSWIVNRDEINYAPCLPTSLIERSQSESVMFFPNPFATHTILQSEHTLNNATISIYNCFGNRVRQIKNISGQTIKLHRHNLSSGLYFIHLTQENKEIITKKIIIID